MTDDRYETWEELAKRFETYGRVPAAQANANVLRRAAAEWEGRVIARGSMHDVRFTVPGDRFPFTNTVRLHWDNEVFEFVLARRGLTITADRCREQAVASVLDSFLWQLVGDVDPTRTRAGH